MGLNPVPSAQRGSSIIPRVGNFFPITVFYLMGAIRCYAPIGRNICPSLGWPPGRRTEGCHDDIYR